MSVLGTGVAHAATVYEITGDWEANTPGTVAKGDVVTGIWRVNVNDDAPAPGNEPVENVTYTVTLQNALFKSLPDLCKTGDGFDPKSAISEDGRTLTCNLGTVEQGTAVVIQTPLVADGKTGDQITAVGEIEGETAELDPIEIRNVFGMDMLWGTPTPATVNRQGMSDFDFEWTLFQDVGSDEGPDTVSYDLTVNLGTGQELELGAQANYEPFNHPCTPFNSYGYSASGHPFTDGYGPEEQQAPFADCEVVKTGRNTFRLTLSNIDYSQTQVPTLDSAGQPLPTDLVAVATGSVWLRVHNLTQSTAANLSSTAPTYTSVTGQTDPDEAGNNTSSKTIVLPGGYSHSYGRISGGSAWDNTFQQPPGATIWGSSHHIYGVAATPPGTVMGECNVLDSQFVTYERNQLNAWYTGDPGKIADPFFGKYEWYVGNDPTVTPGSGSYDPNAFTGCGGTTGWVDVEPADKSTVKAVRWMTTTDAVDGREVAFITFQTIKADAPIGQDIWTFGSFNQDGVWYNYGRDTRPAAVSGEDLTETPNSRYPYTTGQRDKVRVIYALPVITKAGDRSVVRPGEPASFTLTYSATGSGAMPPTVDDYTIVDTLPVGMTYVPGSATPEPTVTTEGGRQVLTWTLDGVPTNSPQTLTYQAVAGDSVEPGQTLTNTATSSLRGETSRPATAQVTTSTSGYTLVGKTTEQWFMNNPEGTGDSTGSWTVTLRSVDPLPQAWTDTIDILPYNGDGRGTDFEGTYEVTSIDVPEGATVYYTTVDPEELSDDPADESNGAPNAPSDIWSTTAVDNPTAIRVIGGELQPGGSFAFDVNIATDGAEPGDVWMNRAQSRAEHTELVMRTSEPLTMGTKYSASLKKYVQDKDGEWHDANDASDYPAFRIGDEVNYRIGVTNTGQGTLTNFEVTDDKFDQGSFTIDELAPGDTEFHEFTTTIEGTFETPFVNTACGAADQPDDAEEPVQVNCDPAGIEVANYKTVKTSNPSGDAVNPGDKVTYTVTVTQEGPVPAEAEFSDNLTDVLDDATIDPDSIEASIGTAELNEGALTWSGTIPVGGVATITYEAVVKSYDEIEADGNWQLDNVVFSDGCATEDDCNPPLNPVGRFIYSKVSDPKSTTAVGPGQSIDYAITVTQREKAAVPGASITDDLTDVLDDATLDPATIKASAGKATLEGTKLNWTGDLAVGDKVTITYTVVVNGAGSDELVNPVTSDDKRGRCDEKIGCKTVHPIGSFLYSKVSNPESGSAVEDGGKITYTITVTQQGKAPLTKASIMDDLTEVLDDADYNGDIKASTGKATVKGDKLSWTGDLKVGATATITYSVTVGEDGDRKLINGVTSDDPRGTCDEPVGCQVEHHKPAPAPGPSLPETGSPALTGVAAGFGLLMLLAGGLVLAIRRRTVGGGLQ